MNPMQQEPGSGLAGSRKWDGFVLPALFLAGGLALYPAARLGPAGFAGAAVLLAALGLLALRYGRHLARSAGERDSLALAAQVEEAQVNYRSIFDNAAQGIFQSTPEGSFITANPALARMLGMENPEELINEMSGWPARHFFADPVRWAEMIRFIESQDSVADFEADVVRKDGRTIRVSQNVHAVWSEEDEILYLEGTVFDITERYWAQRRQGLLYAATRILNEAASVVEARPKILRKICELLDWEMGAVWEVRLPENLLKCVEIWHRQGTDIEEFEEAALEVRFAPGMQLAGKVWQSGEPAWVVNFSEEAFSLNALVAARYGMNSAFGVPIKVGGEVMHVLEFFSPKAAEPDPELLQTLGIVAGQIGYLVERKLGEEALRDTVVRKEAILESALDPIITFDREGRVVEWNPAAERTFGHRKADVLGRPLAELILPEASRTGPGGGLPLYAAGTSFGRRMEIVAVRCDGAEFPAEIAIARVQMHDQPLFTAYLRDITEARQAARLRGELAAIAEATGRAIVTTTPDGFVVSWNAGAGRLFGYAASEMLHRPIALLAPPEREGEELFGREPGSGVVRLETERVCKDGRRIAVSLVTAPIRNERGGVTGYAVLARESGGGPAGEEETAARLAGSVAHDFNNLLTVISGHADLLLAQAGPASPLHKSAVEIRKAGQAATALNRRLMALGRGETPGE